MNIDDLNDMIKAVCPIDGINSNGVIWFKSEATDDQKLQAQIIMNNNLVNIVE